MILPAVRGAAVTRLDRELLVLLLLRPGRVSVSTAAELFAEEAVSCQDPHQQDPVDQTEEELAAKSHDKVVDMHLVTVQPTPFAEAHLGHHAEYYKSGKTSLVRRRKKSKIIFDPAGGSNPLGLPSSARHNALQHVTTACY